LTGLSVRTWTESGALTAALKLLSPEYVATTCIVPAGSVEIEKDAEPLKPTAADPRVTPSAENTIWPVGVPADMESPAVSVMDCPTKIVEGEVSLRIESPCRSTGALRRNRHPRTERRH
jgi:hypothetical protein